MYNEEGLALQLVNRCMAVFDVLPGGPHQLLVVDDGSRDSTRSVLLEAARAEPRLTVVCLSRNFGHQPAMSAAIDLADGDMVMLMDGDLQDPPETLPALLTKMSEGYDVVYAQRVNRKESAWKRFCYHAAYRIISRMSNPPLPVDSGDFALLSRQAVLAMRALPERERYLRGLRTWVGFRQVGVPVERDARMAGEAKYNLRKLIGLALNGAFSFSTTPLRFIGFLGGLTIVSAAAYGTYAVVARFAWGHSPAGFTALAVMLATIGGMILLSLWIIGEYIGRIYDEVKRRPVYVIDKIVNG
jgi:dolichol-phosphate mannosyltransferase